MIQIKLLLDAYLSVCGKHNLCLLFITLYDYIELKMMHTAAAGAAAAAAADAAAANAVVGAADAAASTDAAAALTCGPVDPCIRTNGRMI